MIADFAVCPFTVQPMRAGIPRGHVRYTGTYGSVWRFMKLHTHTYIHIHTYIHTYIQTYIQTYIHTHTRTLIHTHIHTTNCKEIVQTLLNHIIFYPLLPDNLFASSFSVTGDHYGRSNVGLLVWSVRYGVFNGKRNIYGFTCISRTSTFRQRLQVPYFH